MNNEELKARIAELEQQNADLEAKVDELNTQLSNSRESFTYISQSNAKYEKALSGIKSIAELLLP